MSPKLQIYLECANGLFCEFLDCELCIKQLDKIKPLKKPVKLSELR